MTGVSPRRTLGQILGAPAEYAVPEPPVRDGYSVVHRAVAGLFGVRLAARSPRATSVPHTNVADIAEAHETAAIGRESLSRTQELLLTGETTKDSATKAPELTRRSQAAASAVVPDNSQVLEVKMVDQVDQSVSVAQALLQSPDPENRKLSRAIISEEQYHRHGMDRAQGIFEFSQRVFLPIFSIICALFTVVAFVYSAIVFVGHGTVSEGILILSVGLVAAVGAFLGFSVFHKEEDD